MATELDIDDVAAGNPKAERELAELRADKARLRSKLREIRYHANAGHQDRPQWMRIRMMGDLAEEALGTPPEGDINDMELPGMWQSSDFSGGWADTQQPEDALAALNRIALIVYDEESPEPTFMGDMVDEEFDIVRRHLIAETPCPHVRTSDGGTSYCTLAEEGSAVPYVPEQIRRLPDHLEAMSRKHGRNMMPQEANAFHDAANEARDFIERALASAPVVSEYTDEQIIAACKAHDKEVAAQMGEPSPWDVSDELDPMDQWESDRIAAMRAALAAIAAAPTKGGARND